MVLEVYLVYAVIVYLVRLVSSEPMSLLDFLRHEIDGIGLGAVARDYWN
jgi:hypothetical protein